ncbi:MAG: DNA-processing protein DprA [Odoribacter sp.]|nr:DNA-processing protein DprA [Odoribacter sp.]
MCVYAFRRIYKTTGCINFLPRINNHAFLPILTDCGGIEGFFKEKDTAFKALLKSTKFKPDKVNRKEALEKAEKELKLIEKFNISICSFEEENYPLLLKECEDAPLVFYYKGQLATETYHYLAVVRTRKASDRTCERVNILIQELKESGNSFIIVSGLAFGIDGAAHKAALRHGIKTYAVLGHGLHMIYPAAHKNLSDRILDDGGALISEYPCSVAVTPTNFLQRNRIIAGLSQTLLVAESASKGGAMSTARIAQSYNRDVLAIPGRPEDKMSAGCNLLIKKIMRL